MSEASTQDTLKAATQAMSEEPVAWVIGGIDTSGGAGITRDAITLADINVHACVLTTQVANLSLIHI